MSKIKDNKQTSDNCGVFEAGDRVRVVKTGTLVDNQTGITDGYWVEGELSAPPTVGERILVYRDRNPSNVANLKYGVFWTSLVERIEEAIEFKGFKKMVIHTKNSIYEMTKILESEKNSEGAIKEEAGFQKIPAPIDLDISKALKNTWFIEVDYTGICLGLALEDSKFDSKKDGYTFNARVWVLDASKKNPTIAKEHEEGSVIEYFGAKGCSHYWPKIYPVEDKVLTELWKQIKN